MLNDIYYNVYVSHIDRRVREFSDTLFYHTVRICAQLS